MKLKTLIKGLKKEVRIISTYTVVGVGTALGYLFLYIALIKFFSFDPFWAAVVGYLPSMIVGYLLCYYWVFRSVVNHKSTSLKYLLVNGFGYLINAGGIFVTVNIFELDYLNSQLFVFVIVALNNYSLNSFWTFPNVRNKKVANLGINKSVIFNADDFGRSESFNKGIIKSYQEGFLSSTSVIVNGEAYRKGVIDLKKHCPNIGLGIHLNIVEGPSTLDLTNPKSQMYKDGCFNTSFFGIFFKSHNKKFLKEAELEIRNQIEIALKDIGRIDHLNSHRYCTSSPKLFKLTCRLAQEYGIRGVRIPNEKIIFTNNIDKYFSSAFLLNLFKFLILKLFSYFNLRTARKYKLNANDTYCGILYSGFMDKSIVINALEAIKHGECMEILFHPCDLSGERIESFPGESRDVVVDHNRRKELEVLMDKDLMDYINNKKIEVTSYKSINKLSNVQSKKPKLKRSLEIKEGSVLKAFLVIDETSFFHPELVHYILNEMDSLNCVGACRVVLPNGGNLQNYLLKNWLQLGFKDLSGLVLRVIFYKFKESLPNFVKGNFSSSVLSVLKRNDVPFMDISRIDNDTLKYIKSFSPDLIFSSNSLIFPEELLRIPKICCINRHSSPLPSYGGILPVFRAIQFKEKYCGASVHVMDKNLDTGLVLSRKWLPIKKKDSIFKIYKMLFVLSFIALDESIKRIIEGNFSDNPIASDLEPTKSYFSYPDKNDWLEFKKNGGHFI